MLLAEDISFAYTPDRPLLTSWTAEFQATTMTAITGTSGKGKSTLLYLLGLMLRPTGGNVLVDGRPVANLSDRERASLRATLFGFVFQDAALDATRSTLDNVMETALYRGERKVDVRDRAVSLLQQFGVELRADARPGQVSGGQAQRIALCRALLGEPQILLADEPTGNLDAESSDVVMKAMKAHAEAGATVIVVTHDSSVVSWCDRTIEL